LSKNDDISRPIGPVSSIHRRRILQGGAAFAAAGVAGGITGFPFVNRGVARAADAEPLHFWQFYSPGGDVKTQSDWFSTMVDSWNSQNDVKVQLDYVPTADYVGGSKLSTAFASGQGPDIFLISPGDFLRYYNGGVLLELTPFMTPEAQADFPAGIIASRKVDNKIYGLPMELEPMAFYYSKKAFEDAKLAESDIPTTWEQLLELGKKLTSGERYGLLFETQAGYYQNFTWYPFMWEGGGEFQTAEGKSAFDSPGVVQALKLWQDAINSGAAPRQLLGGGGGDIVANLGSGYCAMQNVGIWGISAMDNNAKDVPYGIFKMPTPPGGKYVTVGGGWAFVANAKGKNTDAAGKFVAWALGSMSPDSVKREADWCTVAKSDMPTRTSALEAGKDAFSKGNLALFAKDILPGVRGEPRLPPEVYKIISDAIQQTQLGGADPQATATASSKQLDAFLSTYKGAPML
jgi:multiple sugar transport system substrate-binding protein